MTDFKPIIGNLAVRFEKIADPDSELLIVGVEKYCRTAQVISVPAGEEEFEVGDWLLAAKQSASPITGGVHVISKSTIYARLDGQKILPAKGALVLEVSEDVKSGEIFIPKIAVDDAELIESRAWMVDAKVVESEVMGIQAGDKVKLNPTTAGLTVTKFDLPWLGEMKLKIIGAFDSWWPDMPDKQKIETRVLLCG
jgi:hypothetical protein